MAEVIFENVPVYSLLGDGRVLQTGTHRDVVDGAKYVGGKIFYIDDTAEGAEYTFYSSTGKIIRESDIRVGDEPYAYTVSGTPTKDKYYVFNENAVNSKTWTYNNGSEWVYNSLGTQDGIGKGKTNTAIVLAADGGAYGSYGGTIWNSLNSLNTVADKGCADWFVPSKEELERLRLATDRNGNALTTLFSNTYIWSSFEYSETNAWGWNYYFQGWHYGTKVVTDALVAARGF